MADDIFCKIVAGEVKSDIVLEDADWIAIKDIHPQAPIHVLVIPRRHIGAVADLSETDAELAGKLLVATRRVAEKMGISEGGYRVIINHGEHAGQLVPHLHIHVLGGKNLGSKMVHS